MYVGFCSPHCPVGFLFLGLYPLPSPSPPAFLSHTLTLTSNIYSTHHSHHQLYIITHSLSTHHITLTSSSLHPHSLPLTTSHSSSILSHTDIYHTQSSLTSNIYSTHHSHHQLYIITHSLSTHHITFTSSTLHPHSLPVTTSHS